MDRSLVWSCVLWLALSACGYAAMPMGLHPTVGSKSSGGVSVGVVNSRSFDRHSSLWLVPYAEGVLRKSFGPGQFELRASQGLGWVGAAFELAPESTVSVQLEPGLGVGFYRNASTVTDTVAGQTFTQTYSTQGLGIAPSLAAIVTVARSFYVAPRFGYGWYRTSNDSGGGSHSSDEDTTTVGGTVGWIHEASPFSYTAELTVVRTSRGFMAAGDPDAASAAWLFVPTFGVQIVGE